MARNRQRAKQRRDRREVAPRATVPGRRARPDDDPLSAPDPLEHASPDVELADAQLAVGRPELTEAEAEQAALDADPGDPGLGAPDELEEGDPLTTGVPMRDRPRTPAGEDDAIAPSPTRRPAAGEGNRVTNFLRGSWRELQRVQWPDRRQVAQATGVVLVFVIVAGGYLGLMDAIFSRLVNAVL